MQVNLKRLNKRFEGKCVIMRRTDRMQTVVAEGMFGRFEKKPNGYTFVFAGGFVGGPFWFSPVRTTSNFIEVISLEGPMPGVKYRIEIDVSVKGAFDRKAKLDALAQQEIDTIARTLSDQIPKGCYKWAQTWDWLRPENLAEMPDWKLPERLQAWIEATQRNGAFYTYMTPDDLYAYGFKSFKDAFKNVAALARAWRKSVKIEYYFEKSGNKINRLSLMISVVGYQKEEDPK